MQSTTEALAQDLQKIAKWADQSKSVIRPLTFNGIPVMTVDKTKHLGILILEKTRQNQSGKERHWLNETIISIYTA